MNFGILVIVFIIASFAVFALSQNWVDSADADDDRTESGVFIYVGFLLVGTIILLAIAGVF